MSDVEVSSISIGIGAPSRAGMLIAVSPMLYASVISLLLGNRGLEIPRLETYVKAH